MMPTIMCHPANVELLRKAINQGTFDNGMSPSPHRWFSFDSFTIQPSSLMERDKPTGRYIVGGKAVSKDAIRIHERFIEYGPEDLEWLLYSGRIREEREPLFLL